MPPSRTSRSSSTKAVVKRAATRPANTSGSGSATSGSATASPSGATSPQESSSAVQPTLHGPKALLIRYSTPYIDRAKEELRVVEREYHLRLCHQESLEQQLRAAQQSTECARLVMEQSKAALRAFEEKYHANLAMPPDS